MESTVFVFEIRFKYNHVTQLIIWTFKSKSFQLHSAATGCTLIKTLELKVTKMNLLNNPNKNKVYKITSTNIKSIIISMQII